MRAENYLKLGQMVQRISGLEVNLGDIESAFKVIAGEDDRPKNLRLVLAAIAFLRELNEEDASAEGVYKIICTLFHQEGVTFDSVKRTLDWATKNRLRSFEGSRGEAYYAIQELSTEDFEVLRSGTFRDIACSDLTKNT